MGEGLRRLGSTHVRTNCQYVCICIFGRMQREWLCSILYVLCMYISIRILCSVCCSIGSNGCIAVTVGK